METICKKCGSERVRCLNGVVNGKQQFVYRCRECTTARHRDRRGYRPAIRREETLEQYKQRRLQQVKEFTQSHPVETRAQKAAHKAIVSGKLVRQPCEVCGEEKVHAHHDDYTKPLEVRWLCPSHHRLEHFRQKGIHGSAPYIALPKSPPSGCWFDRRQNRWYARIRVNGLAINLGSHSSKNEAEAAYRRAVSHYRAKA